jgi:hypothetical protein
MTARELIVASFSDLNINDPGEAIEPADAQTALRLLNNLCSTWRTQSLITIAIVRQIFNLEAGKQVYSIGLGADFNVSRPVEIPAAGLLLSGLSATASISIARTLTVATVTWTAHEDNAVEIPRPITTDQNWQGVQLKLMPSGLFTGVYYNPTQPYGTITLWPVPDTNENQLVLYLQQQFEGFADFDTDYTFPDLPGMSEALQYNLDIRLAIPFASAAEMTPDIKELARTSLGLVKRQNYRMRDLGFDPAITNDARGGYNINTGQGG